VLILVRLLRVFSAQFEFGRFIMLYWLGVYTLVAIVALVPFFLLYVLWFLVWLSLTAIRFMIRSVNNAIQHKDRGIYDSSRHHEQECVDHS
jgi:hypothetical protein